MQEIAQTTSGRSLSSTDGGSTPLKAERIQLTGRTDLNRRAPGESTQPSGQLVFLEAEVVPDLVDHGVADLPQELAAVPTGLEQR